MEDFNERTVVITGGATGIGFALAKRFGKDGANILIGEPRQERLDTAIAALRSEDITAHAMQLDVTEESSFAAFADFAWDTFGAVHLLINNAGIALAPRKMLRQTVDDARRIFDVNVFGVWNGSHIFGTRMVEQNIPAAIYNVSSENAFFNATSGIAAYIASKHAVRGLTEAMREEFPDYITIGLICPGFVKSELTPPPFGKLAMDADIFADKVVQQIKAREFYVVTHPYNIEHIRPVHSEIESAYTRNAPRYEGDDAFDVRLLLSQLQSKNTR